MGRSVIDFELLFEQLIAARKPLSFDGLASGPEFRALATSLETLSLRVLAGFADIDELMRGGAGERIAAQARRRAARIPGRADGGRRPDRADPGRDSAARGGHPPMCLCWARDRRDTASPHCEASASRPRCATSRDWSSCCEPVLGSKTVRPKSSSRG